MSRCIRTEGDTLYVMDQISDKKHLEENWVKDMALKDAVNRLPERERMIIELRFFRVRRRWRLLER